MWPEDPFGASETEYKGEVSYNRKEAIGGIFPPNDIALLPNYTYIGANSNRLQLWPWIYLEPAT